MRNNASGEAIATCMLCGAGFTPARRGQRFCSPTCRAGFHSVRLPGGKLAALAKRVEAIEAELAQIKAQAEADYNATHGGR